MSIFVLPGTLVTWEQQSTGRFSQSDSKDKQMKKKGILIAGILLVLVCILGGILYIKTRPEASKGEKHISVTVVYLEQKEETFTYDTDLQYLGEVLQEEGLIEGEESEYGLFITTVNGETADDSKQQWWCITKAGEQVNTSVDTTPIEDGDSFELTLKEGY